MMRFLWAWTGLWFCLLTVGSTPRVLADGMPGTAPAPNQETPTPTPPPEPETPDAYTQAMIVGYAAAEQKDYQTALINFRRALAERPGDRYALAAIRNMETYIAQQQAEAAKRREIDRLQTVLAAAVDQRDWACAAATVDRLVMLVPPDSSERERLIGYRGELTGFLDARTDVDRWSTVCPGTI